MLMWFLLGIVHESLQTAGRRFLEKAGVMKTITEQSLSAARNKIRWEAFQLIYRSTVEVAYEGYAETWNRYLVYAIDGTKTELPHDPKLEALFGEEKGSPLARCSVCYDVLNHVIADAAIEPLNVCERTLAKRHIEAISNNKITAKSLAIHDRGYASEEYIRFLRDKKVKFLFRVKRKFNKRIDDFNKKDGCINLFGMRLRVIKITLDSGEVETLITDLLDVPYDEFKALYFLRWGVEKEYDVVKNKLEITNFSGRTETAIRQDFFIHMTYANIIAATEWEAQEELELQNADKNLKYDYKINTNHTVGVFRYYLTRIIFTNSPKKRAVLWDKVLELTKSAVVPIRPDRKVERIVNTRKAKHHHNHKSNL